MSTSIAANVAPRPAAPETHLNPPPAHPAQEEQKPHASAPADNVAFTSPVIKVDSDTGLALLVVRDGSTGEELDQYPSKKVVAEYQRIQGSSSDTSTPAASPDTGAALASNAVVPPAPVAAPPVSPATGDARTTVLSGGSGVKPVGL